jgi:hypothetical protein
MIFYLAYFHVSETHFTNEKWRSYLLKADLNAKRFSENGLFILPLQPCHNWAIGLL